MNDMETRAIKLQYFYIQPTRIQSVRGYPTFSSLPTLCTRESSLARGLSDSDIYQSIVLYIPKSGCHYVEAIKKYEDYEMIELFYPHHYPACGYVKSGKKEE